MIKTNKIYNIDCIKGMQQLPDKSIDLTITSPPYDNLREYKGYKFNFKETANQLYRITKEGGIIVWIISDATINGSETGTSFKQALYFKDIGFNIHDTMIWQKQTFTATGTLQVRYGDVFDYMFIFSKGKTKTFNPIRDRRTKGPRKKHGTVRQQDGTTKKQSSLGKVYANKNAQRFNIWKINTEVNNNKRLHPAQFPEQIAYDHIISWSNKGDTILDPFIGSGTTALVCKQLNRKYIGFEISKEYYNIAKRRLAEHPTINEWL